MQPPASPVTSRSRDSSSTRPVIDSPAWWPRCTCICNVPAAAAHTHRYPSALAASSGLRRELSRNTSFSTGAAERGGGGLAPPISSASAKAAASMHAAAPRVIFRSIRIPRSAEASTEVSTPQTTSSPVWGGEAS